MSKKILSEQETRRRLLLHAKERGREKDVRMIFDKYDRLLNNCTDDGERADIAKLAAYEVFQALDAQGELYIDGQVVMI